MTLDLSLLGIFSLDSQSAFNDYYSKNLNPQFTNELFTFFEEKILPRLPAESLRVLEVGGGNYSIFEKWNNEDSEIVSIDFSSKAIKNSPVSKINYLEKDVTANPFLSMNDFDLVFDSHCFNCILDSEKRKLAFNNVFQVLKADGLFAGEFMIQASGNRVEIPYKKILRSHDLEEEFKANGFKILYFVIHSNKKFYSEVNSSEIYCDLVQVIARK